MHVQVFCNEPKLDNTRGYAAECLLMLQRHGNFLTMERYRIAVTLLIPLLSLMLCVGVDSKYLRPLFTGM